MNKWIYKEIARAITENHTTQFDDLKEYKSYHQSFYKKVLKKLKEREKQ